MKLLQLTLSTSKNPVIVNRDHIVDFSPRTDAIKGTEITTTKEQFYVDETWDYIVMKFFPDAVNSPTTD